MKTTTAIVLISLVLLCTSGVHADTFGSGANQFDIEFVPIGNPGNAADTDDGASLLPGIQNFGFVDYSYRIGKYEVSEDMINKANAQSSLDGDPLSITHHNFPDVEMPATDISWYEAAKFVNWLNTSTGHKSAYKFDDSGTFQLWTAGDAGYNSANPFRNSQAYYFLPSADEWYKTAYYDPNAGVYYDYPTGSDSVPDGIDFAGDPNFDGVFSEDFFQLYGANDITDVGVLSPYGTAGQGGNVWEWEETDYDLVNDSGSTYRGLRGGAWGLKAFDLHSSRWQGIRPTDQYINVGFRVASAIPEPCTALLLCVGALCATAYRHLSLHQLPVDR